MNSRQRATVRALLDEYGQTFAAEAGIHIEHDTPAPLFQLLFLSMLLSAPIQSGNAMEAATALRKEGLTTPRKMAETSWQDRVDVITWHGYKRYDERGSTLLGQLAEQVLERYCGDLRRLRAEAHGDVQRLEALLKEFKGIGKVGASIFLREVQLVWPEVYPYADERVLRAAAHLELGKDPKSLAKLVPRADFPRFVAALIRVDLAKAHDAVRHHAA